MKVELDHEIKCIINASYNIDASILRQIEQRRQLADSAQSLTKTIYAEAPRAPDLPQESSDIVIQLINNTNYDTELKKRQLNSVLDLLSGLDALIDRIDALIQKIDEKAFPLVQNINNHINSIKAAYNNQITSGCKSDLTWELAGSSFGGFTNGGQVIRYTMYKVVKNPALEIRKNNRGIKYYQKPLNRDYGFQISSTFNGSISIGTTSIAVLTSGEISNIQLNDEITDNLDNPVAFNAGNLPRVVGFGTTSILGISTSDYFNVSAGSTVISFIGIGTTTNINVNQYLTNFDFFENNTKVVGFGTTVTTIVYNNVGPSTFISTTTTVPSVILSKPAFNTGKNILIGFGTFTQYDSIQINISPYKTLNNDLMFAIRKVENVEENFDYTANPLDPVKIAPMTPSQTGFGHRVEYSDDGAPSTPALWSEVARDPEPQVGADQTVYYDGVQSWPYDFLTGYAVEGLVYTFAENMFPSSTPISPVGVTSTSPICIECASTIATLNAQLPNVIEENKGKIENLLTSSETLRKIRDRYELLAWSYLQSASYLRGEINKNDNYVKNLKGNKYK